MKQRVLALFRARLRAQLGGEVVPAAPLLAHGSLVGLLALLVRDALSPYSYTLFTLTASAGLVALTLLGELGGLLRADAASEWSETLPARPIERRLANGLVALALLSSLALGALLPAAIFAPAGMGFAGRALLVLTGLEQAFAIGALLLGLQLLLGARGEGLLVLMQTLLVVAVVAGFLTGLRLVPSLRELDAGRGAWPHWLLGFPPAWFAAATSGSSAPARFSPSAWVHLAAPAAAGVLLLAPEARAVVGRSSGTFLAWLLAPARALATRTWVAKDERGVFELVFAALPLEREFVLRTYPMIGIPLAFLLAGAKGEAGPERQGLLALLLFTPAVYLPVLIAQVPGTGSPGARWLLDCAPVPHATVRNATIKALAVRFLVPLYLCLAAVAVALGEARFALLLALPGALVSLFVLRQLYPRITHDPPLSTAPDEIELHHDWMGMLLTLAVALVVLALFAQRAVDSPLRALGLIALLLLVEFAADFSARRQARAET